MATFTQDDKHRMINIKDQALNTTDLDEFESEFEIIINRGLLC